MGRKIAPKLDSPAAAYNLSTYLQDRRAHPELDARIERLRLAAVPDRLPDRNELIAVAREFSTDFAALYFADCAARQPANADLLARFCQHLDHPASADAARSPGHANYLLLFVPGWDYRANGSLTGSDLARPRALATSLGLANRLVEVDPLGAVEANARFIQKALATATSSGQRLILVGASSAGPAIHPALHQLFLAGAPTPAAWINLGGILQGSPLWNTS